MICWLDTLGSLEKVEERDEGHFGERSCWSNVGEDRGIIGIREMGMVWSFVFLFTLVGEGSF